MRTPLAFALWLSLSLSLSLSTGCTFHHSKQALMTTAGTPSDKARFVTEEDSGLALLGLFQLSEPDHYSVLLERARRKHQCATMRDAQLDFYTDYWLVLSFPISRITLVCEPSRAPAAQVTAPSPSAAAPKPGTSAAPAAPPPPPAASSSPAAASSSPPPAPTNRVE